MAGAGYTPAEIDAMPAQDVWALLRHWSEIPPLPELLAAVHRIEMRHVDADDPSGIGTLIARG